MGKQLEEKTAEEQVEETAEEKVEEKTAEKESISPAEKEELVQLKEYRRHNQILMSGNASASEQEASLRFIMKSEGFSPDQIEAYIAENVYGGEAPDTSQKEEVKTVGEQRSEQETREVGETSPNAALKQEIEQLKRQLAEKVAGDQRETMERQFNGALDSQMEGETVKALLDKAKEMGQDVQKTRKAIRDSLERTTMSRLRERRTRFPDAKLTETWIQEEAKAAVSDTLGLFRSVIGDPAQVAKAPETASGEDGFIPKEPPKEPEVDETRSPAEALAVAKDYTTKSLLHLAANIEEGGESKA